MTLKNTESPELEFADNWVQPVSGKGCSIVLGTVAHRNNGSQKIAQKIEAER